MTTEPVPLRRRKLADEVEDRVLAFIQDKGLKPGDKLPSERELMVTYQVGRPAIREAMQNLQRTGLVRIRHGERPRVAEPSMDAMVEQMAQSMRHLLNHSEATMKHLKDARVVFESEMARIAARKRTAGDLAKLKVIIDRQSQLLEDASAFLEWDGEFHSMISAMSSNPIFKSLSHSLFGWLSHFHVDMVRMPGLEKLTLEEHRAIYDAIEASDEKSAGKLMADHLNRANSLYHQANHAPPA